MRWPQRPIPGWKGLDEDDCRTEVEVVWRDVLGSWALLGIFMAVLFCASLIEHGHP
jgi:hypothetical protein